MLVSVPLHLDLLPGRPAAGDLEAALMERYGSGGLVTVTPTLSEGKRSERLEPEALNDTDRMELRVFSHDSYNHAVLVARLDNLGKGASGAAVQNIQLMLGLI
jgi:N-acetyl-gamma-glutamyl-phosphate reductase